MPQSPLTERHFANESAYIKWQTPLRRARTKSSTSLFLRSRHTGGRYATTPLSLFLPCSFSFFHWREENEWNFSRKHTKNLRAEGEGREDAGTPWLLHHYTGKEHPKQACPDLARTYARTHTSVGAAKHIHEKSCRAQTQGDAHANTLPFK